MSILTQDLKPSAQGEALNYLSTSRLLIFIVAYNAQSHIESVLDRIPRQYWQDPNCEVLIIDDASKDDTSQVCSDYRARTGRRFTVLKNPINQGYGGNQKIGYSYAIKHSFDCVVLLHGDGQYPPEMIPDLIEPILDNKASACFGSRMIDKGGALKGGMPLYKFIGNKILTKFQNWVVGSQLSEYHSGFRAYCIKALSRLPFQANSDDFDFDTDIIIQLVHSKNTIAEIAIPTRYGQEICHVNGFRYARQIVTSSLVARLQKFQIYYHPRFDLEGPQIHYPAKIDFDSTHTWAIGEVKSGATVADIGLGAGGVAKILKETKAATIYGYDFRISPEAAVYCAATQDINLETEPLKFPKESKVNYVLLLDVIEHLSDPEGFLKQLRAELSAHQGQVLISTGNVGFCLIRLSLLMGRFNYGKRGILDLTHKRLFTFHSMKKLLEQQGYIIEYTGGIPVPFGLVFGNSFLARLCLAINRAFIWLSRSLFSFQIVMRVRPKPTLEHLLSSAQPY